MVEILSRRGEVHVLERGFSDTLVHKSAYTTHPGRRSVRLRTSNKEYLFIVSESPVGDRLSCLAGDALPCRGAVRTPKEDPAQLRWDF